MRREQAFYDDAKLFIVHFVELAQTTLCRACRINPTLKHPFHISQCPRKADTLLEAYMSLVQAVRNYEYKFVEPDYRSRLTVVFRTVEHIPNKPPPVPIASSSHVLPAPITVTQYSPPPSIRSPSTPKVASQFTYTGMSPSVSSLSTPLYGNTFGNMVPRPIQSAGLISAVPSSLPPHGGTV
ncbi:hypothetical protein BDY19DRAFT_685155 [Irpex rosettiformis]|uniref:Uncharacterized protein n=1 Tax=Irpex rosettiformis TaxID=378272 RepID=A0ACB8U9Y6_9APHY|nr:hypothetical protein BDY19DRAFT_685155 [Irpex rosettiformis]